MNRRSVLLGAGAVFIGTGLASTGLALRLHRTPRQNPFLTEAHLTSLARGDLPRPRVLFIGNSMVLRNDLPGQVRTRARAEGVTLHTAMAAAEGARLVETLRLPALPKALAAGWDAIVLQDFTKTPLRTIDRWASARAIRRIAHMGAPAKILLYPPWPAATGSTVYRDPGFLTARPETPADFATRTMAHYNRLGHPVAPVPEAWLEAVASGRDLYDSDGHHPNPDGTELVADILWKALKPLI